MTSKEKLSDANMLLDLKMMDTVIGGKVCPEGCLLACSAACVLWNKGKTPSPS